MKQVKDWDNIMKDYSSGEESDEYDEPNIVSLKKHGPKVLEMLSNAIDSNKIPLEHLPANNKATTNRSQEPVTERFKNTQSEVTDAVIKQQEKKLAKTPA